MNRTETIDMSKINQNEKSWGKYLHTLEECYEYAVCSFFNPYGIENLQKYTFVDSKYFNNELSHICHGNKDYISIIVNRDAIIADFNETEKLEFKTFLEQFVNQYRPDESADDYTLCFVVNIADRNKYPITESKYFNIGLYSYSKGRMVENKKVLLDNLYTEWLPTVKAYSKVLKQYGEEVVVAK